MQWIASTFQGHHLGCRIHDDRVCGNGSSNEFIVVGHVYDDDLVCFIDLFANTDETVGFHREGVEADAGSIDAEGRQLEYE